MSEHAASPRSPRPHGGPGARGPVRWDFSTNANAAGPCPTALLAVQQADPCRYPDPGYHALRKRLAAWHGVAPQRILLAASASEFIQRITAASGRLAPGAVAVPPRAYGDYAAAAQACGRAVLHAEPTAAQSAAPRLRWCTDPGSPLGQPQSAPADPGQVITVLDAAYAPLSLDPSPSWPQTALDAVFQLHSPNKALGLTGVRGAYVVAPAAAQRHAALISTLVAAEPSWPLGAHAVALLTAWTEPATQQWLGESLAALRTWRDELRSGLHALGLAPQPSVTPFLCARRPPAATDDWLQARGLAVRCTASFGLPGQMRVSAQTPQATALFLSSLSEALAVTPRLDAAPHHPTFPLQPVEPR
jgi:histidinol-phosphate aminotransferase